MNKQIRGINGQIRHMNGSKPPSGYITGLPQRVSPQKRAEIGKLKNERDALFGQRATARAAGDKPTTRALTKSIGSKSFQIDLAKGRMRRDGNYGQGSSGRSRHLSPGRGTSDSYRLKQ